VGYKAGTVSCGGDRSPSTRDYWKPFLSSRLRHALERRVNVRPVHLRALIYETRIRSPGFAYVRRSHFSRLLALLLDPKDKPPFRRDGTIRCRIIYGGWSFAMRFLSRYPAKSDFRLWRGLSRRRRSSTYICIFFTLKGEWNLNASWNIFLSLIWDAYFFKCTARARAADSSRVVCSVYSWSCVTSGFPKKLIWFRSHAE